MTAEPSRNLVLVHSAGWQDVADFHAIKLRVEKTAPDIEVFVASNDIRSSLTRKRAAERPTLVFSPIRLLAFRPARGKVYAGRHMSKLIEMRRLADGGVRGFRLGFRDRPADWAESAAMDRFWRLAGENRLAICPLLGPESLPAIGRLCSRHPSTTVVIDHLARIGALGPIQEGDVRALEALAAHASVNVKVSAFYALRGQPAPYLKLAPMIRRIFAAFGPRRLMWGSDSPFQVSNGNHYADSFALVHDHLDFLSAADRECLLRTTAERVFFQRQQSTGRA